MASEEKIYMSPTAFALGGSMGGPIIRLAGSEYIAMSSEENQSKIMSEWATQVIESYKARDEASKSCPDTSLETEEKISRRLLISEVY